MNQPENKEPRGKILKKIEDDMKVIDKDGDDVGQVDLVHFGEATEDRLEWGKGAATPGSTKMPEDESIITDILKALTPGGEMPDVVRERMLREGFVRVDTEGIFKRKRFILPEQIENVVENRLKLNVGKEELIEE